mgnify:FL=1
MTIELLLLLLRLASGALLGCVLVIIFWVLWRDYQSAAAAPQRRRRVYGALVALRDLDGQYLATGERHPLLALTSLGRAPTNTIRIEDSFASSEHALVVMRDGQWWLEDRNSRNGTTLNDLPVTEPVILTQGDIIGIGQLKFRIELEP